MQTLSLSRALSRVRSLCQKSVAPFSAGVLATGLALGAGSANAALVITTGDEGNIATAIVGLDLNGEEYFVNFEIGTANDFYGSGTPRNYDFDDIKDAQDAVNAINEALNNKPLTEIILVGGALDRNNSDEYYVGYLDVGSNTVETIRGGYNEPIDWENLDRATVAATDELIYAEFTRTDVPEIPIPAAVWLFGSGLIGLVGVARRKQPNSS